MKSKFLFGLVAMMVVLALAPSSFAQVNLQVFPQTSPQEIQTGRAVQTGDPTSTGSGLLISGAIVASSPLTTTTLVIDYPGILTSSGPCQNRAADGTPIGAPPGTCPSIPAADPLRIEGATGLFAGATISSINYGTGVVEITLGGTRGLGGAGVDIPATLSGSFRLVGARLDVNGLTAPVTATFSLSSTANNYILSTTSGTVINAVGAGMTAPVIGTRTSTTASVGQGITVFTNRNLGGAGVSFTITEGFASAFRSSAQLTTDPSTRTTPNSTQVRLTFTGLQTGMTLTVATPNVTSTLGTLPTAGTWPKNVTATSTTVTFNITTSSLTATETIQFDVTMAAPSTTGAAFTTGAIQVTATMFPVGAALGNSLQPDSTAGYPQFAQADLGPLTIGNVISPTTVMLIPYAVADLGFDTGIAVANTTADPFGGAASGGATAASGPVTVSLYGRTATGATPTVVAVTTSATVRPGAGLDSSGNLNSGSTWTVLLSELRTAAGQTGSFTGYIFIQAPFIDAHGASFISDFRSFTSASPVLVLAPPASASRSNPGGGVETLGN